MDSLLCCFPFLVLVGVGFIAAADRHHRKLRRLRRDGTRATGWVVGHDENTHAGRTTFVPVVSYRDRFGVERRFRMSVVADRTDPPVGTEVPVLYLPDDPDLVDADSAAARRAGLRTPLTIGIILLGISAVIGIAGLVGFLSRIEVH